MARLPPLEKLHLSKAPSKFVSSFSNRKQFPSTSRNPSGQHRGLILVISSVDEMLVISVKLVSPIRAVGAVSISKEVVKVPARIISVLSVGKSVSNSVINSKLVIGVSNPVFVVVVATLGAVGPADISCVKVL